VAKRTNRREGYKNSLDFLILVIKKPRIINKLRRRAWYFIPKKITSLFNL
jgi:hypothetical protein